MVADELESTLKAALKKYGLRVGSLGDLAEDVEAFTTGNLAIDHAIGVGGLPVGRMVELFGPPSCGKTTTALQAAAELQKLIIAGGNTDPRRGPLVDPGDVIGYFDYEHALDPVYARALGLDMWHPSFLFAQPESLEQGANVARQLIETGRMRMAIFDSVAAMTPSAKAEAEIGKSLPAVQAKLMADFLAPLVEQLHRCRCTAVFVNHIMELMEMGGRPGVKRTSTPGGRALKFYASVRIEYQQIGNVKAEVLDALTQEKMDQVVATNVRARVVKNKVAAPFRQVLVRVRYGKGFDNFWSAMQVLVAHKLVTSSAGYFYFEKSPDLVTDDMPRQATGTRRPHLRGEPALLRFADERPEWRSRAIALAEATLAATGSAGLEDMSPADAEDEEHEDTPPPELSDSVLGASTAAGRRVKVARADDSDVVGIDALLGETTEPG